MLDGDRRSKSIAISSEKLLGEVGGVPGPGACWRKEEKKERD
jgi:hypothetical protein